MNEMMFPKKNRFVLCDGKKYISNNFATSKLNVKFALYLRKICKTVIWARFTICFYLKNMASLYQFEGLVHEFLCLPAWVTMFVYAWVLTIISKHLLPQFTYRQRNIPAYLIIDN